MGRSALYGFVLLVSVIMLATVGCGKKTMVVPPETEVPEPITDLGYSFTGKGVELHWSYPLKTVAGNDLDTVKSFVVWRAEIAEETYCSGCPIPFKRLVKMKAERPPGPGKKNRLVSFEDVSIRPGYHYIYNVRASRGWLGDGADSNIIEFLRQEE
jgi:hypothetical protein